MENLDLVPGQSDPIESLDAPINIRVQTQL